MHADPLSERLSVIAQLPKHSYVSNALHCLFGELMVPLPQRFVWAGCRAAEQIVSEIGDVMLKRPNGHFVPGYGGFSPMAMVEHTRMLSPHTGSP